jgi:hypothetical protein
MTEVHQADLTATVERLQSELERLTTQSAKFGNLLGCTVTYEPIDALAHCPNWECDKFSEQIPVKATRKLVTSTYGQRDPDNWSGAMTVDPDKIENSWEYLVFPEGADPNCSVCRRPLELATQVRERYDRLSEQDPMLLLKRKRSGISPEMVIAEMQKKAAEGDNSEIKELREQLARQQQMLAFVMGQQTGQAQTLPPELAEMLTGSTPAPEPDAEPETEAASPEPSSEPLPSGIPDSVLPPGIIRLDHDRFKAIWRDENGKQRSATRPTAQEAIDVREQRRGEVAARKAAGGRE